VAEERPIINNETNDTKISLKTLPGPLMLLIEKDTSTYTWSNKQQ
jgi:hypothetical protein